MSAENSGLYALAELRALEASRIAADHDRRLQSERAEADAREQVARAAAAAEQQAAWERQMAWQRAVELQQAAELAERQRSAAVAEQARVEQQHRLRIEADRLDERMRAAERASRPRWPYVVVPALVAAIGLSAAIAWHSGGEADRVAAADSAQRNAYEQQMAAVQEKLDVLAQKQQRLEDERNELAQRLLDATTASERNAIEAQIAAVDRELAEVEPATTTTDAKVGTTRTTRKPGGGKPGGSKPSGSKPGTSRDPEDTTKPSGRKPIVVGEGSDPLDGLD